MQPMKLSQTLMRPLGGGRIRSPTRRDAVTIQTPGIVYGGGSAGATPEGAQRLSAVFAAVEIRSDDMSVLPAYVYDTRTRRRVDHPVLQLLSVRPNPMMAPAVRKKLLERSVLLTGNAYDWIIRDPVSRAAAELIPIPGNLVQIEQDSRGRLWYQVKDPKTLEIFILPEDDVCHYKGPTNDGIHGMAVLTYAAQTVQAGLAAQSYNKAFYESGGQPAGILTVEGDFGGYIKDANGLDTTKTKKDAIREEWERVHSGPDNAHRIAVLDYGMKYQALSISQKDAEFIAQMNATVEDVARFFCVPLYKLQAGKQSYNSNEQNAIEYQGRLQPRVTQMEEEQTWKLLPPQDQRNGLEIRYNMMALLRSDSESRAKYYQTMEQIGAYSVNDVLELEDRPVVEGGDEHMASLNYVPLSVWKELSLKRNGGGGETE